MNLREWTAEIIRELNAAGFPALEYHGFPLMKMPATHAERVRLLDFQTAFAADRRIYAEGMIFIPAGAWEKFSGEAMRETVSEIEGKANGAKDGRFTAGSRNSENFVSD